MELWNIHPVKHSVIYDLYPHTDEADRLILLAIAAKIGEEGCRVLAVAIDRMVRAEVDEVVKKCSEQSMRKK